MHPLKNRRFQCQKHIKSFNVAFKSFLSYSITCFIRKTTTFLTTRDFYVKEYMEKYCVFLAFLTFCLLKTIFLRTLVFFLKSLFFARSLLSDDKQFFDKP